MTERSKAYLEYIQASACCVTGTYSHEYESVIAHHVRCLGGGGMGLKPSDYLTIPLTVGEHGKLHKMGERGYWASKNIDPESLVTGYLREYLSLIKIDYKDLIGFIVQIT